MKDKLFWLMALMAGVMSGLAAPTMAFAAVDYSTTFQAVGTEANNAISAVLPIAVPVLAIIIGVGIAIKVIRRVTGR